MYEPFEPTSGDKELWKKQVVAIVIGLVLGNFLRGLVCSHYPDGLCLRSSL